MKTIIVIPEGLSVVASKTVPSFVFRAVLDYVAKQHRGDTILLAPANNFGREITEQEAAFNYLRNLGVESIYHKTSVQRYHDSIDNIVELKKFCHQENIALPTEIIIVCGIMHAFRIRIILKILKVKYLKVIAVDYKTINEPIVSRLWFYKFKLIHFFYEIASILYHIPRLITQRITQNR